MSKRIFAKGSVNIVIPVAIICAGLLIAIGVYFSGSSTAQVAGNTNLANSGHSRSQQLRLPEESDHVRGNLSAPIAVIEFSDFECPFCSRLHPTLSRLVAENEDVKWIYRHFPLSNHSKAFGAAVASECVAKLGGNDAFWNFADNAFNNQRSLSTNFYEQLATSNGIDAGEFGTCLKDNSIAAEVQRDLDESINSGGRGTPFAIVVTADSRLIPFSGALPYEQLQALVAQARNY